MSALFQETLRVAHLCDGETTRLFILLASEAMLGGSSHVERSTMGLCALAGVAKEETLLSRRRKLEHIDAIRVQFRLGACNLITIPVLLDGGTSDGPPPAEPTPLKEDPPYSQGDNCSDLDRKKDRRKKEKIDQSIKVASLVSEPSEPAGPAGKASLPEGLPAGTIRFSETQPFYTRPVPEQPEVDPVLGVEGVDWVYQYWRKWKDLEWIVSGRDCKRPLRNLNEPLRLKGELEQVETPPVEQAEPAKRTRAAQPYVPVLGENNLVTQESVAAQIAQSLDQAHREREFEKCFREEIEMLLSRFRYIGNGIMQSLTSAWESRPVQAIIEATHYLRLKPDLAMAALTAA